MCKCLVVFSILVLIFVYLIYVFFVFNILDVIEKVNGDNVCVLVVDIYSYKVYVICDNWNVVVIVVIEGEKKGCYFEGILLEWVSFGDIIVIDLGEGYIVIFGFEIIIYDVSGYGFIKVMLICV